MDLSDEQKEVARRIGDGDNVFITGSGGVGKTFLLKHLLAEQLRYKRVEVTAYTGVAALPIGGTTFHSLIGVKPETHPGEYSPEQFVWQARSHKTAKKRMRNCDVIVVDEISMCDARLLNVADYVLKRIREDQRPFGGVQMILLGDFLQLPPPGKGKSTMCYDSVAWREAGFRIFQLNKVFRQRDEELIGHLNAVRRGKIELETSLFFQKFVRKPAETVTELYALNHEVNRRNAEELARLPSHSRTYHAEDAGNQYYINFLAKNCMAPTELDLKIGAYVMVLKNLPQHGLVNGSTGKVAYMGADTVTIAVKRGGGTDDIELEPAKWQYTRDGRIVATRLQIPLRLAYAQTIHKSQGQTLPAAFIDIDASFDFGHAYTGLSRVTGTEGLYLNGFNPFMVKTCPRTVELYDLIDKREPGFRLGMSDRCESLEQ